MMTLALTCQGAATPELTTNLQITPSATCRDGQRTESIRLSRANGDAIDGVFLYCRDPAMTKKAWIARLKTTREMLILGTEDRTAKAAIRKAFAAHIARERAAP